MALPLGFGEMSNTPDFGDRLSALCSIETAASRGDADRFGTMIERLSAALGFTIAMAARGDASQIDKFVTGAEGYIHREAVAKAPFAQFMSQVSDHD